MNTDTSLAKNIRRTDTRNGGAKLGDGEGRTTLEGSWGWGEEVARLESRTRCIKVDVGRGA